MKPKTIKVVEGVGGHWHYHLRVDGDILGLCHARVMHCSLPIKSWGVRTELNERYCEQCFEIYQSLPEALDNHKSSLWKKMTRFLSRH